jgi:hypothetical protein
MSLSHLNDFPDRLSPMLVKELRQGLRARGFIILFMALQVALGFVLLSTAANLDSSNAGTATSGIIFTFFSIAVVIVQPMRGIAAIRSEITGNTLEMMALTRLNAARIVFGKWFAIVGQSALILITIIPYLILRYFFGGMNLVGEIVLLLMLFLTSIAFTALTVGGSGGKANWFRGIIPVVVFFSLFTILPRMLFSGGSTDLIEICSLNDASSRVGVLCYTLGLAYLSWCVLSHGISTIAPIAENHSSLRRLIALGLMILVVACNAMGWIEPIFLPAIFAFIGVPAIISALTDRAIMLPPVCVPFLKRGPLGKIAGFFLYPCWASGGFFTALIGAIAIGTLWFSPSSSYRDKESMIVFLACFGGLIFPALLATFYGKWENRLGTYIAYLILTIVLFIIPSVFSGITNREDAMFFFIWNPITFLFLVQQNGANLDHLLVSVSLVDAGILTLLLIQSFRAYLKFRPVIEQAKKEISGPPLTR